MTERRYSIPEGVVYAQVCGCPVLATTSDIYDSTDSIACLLNEEGAEIWNWLKRGLTESEIIRNMAEHYQEEEARIAEDLQRFLAALAAQGYLRQED